MKSTIFRYNRVLITSVFLFLSLQYSFGNQEDIADQIRFRFETDQPKERLEIREVPLASGDGLFPFYTAREFVPVWSENGILKEMAYELRFEIKQAKYDGLNPKDYHLDLFDAFFETFEQNKEAGNTNEIADVGDLDIFLTDAFFRLARDLEVGKVDPSVLKAEWEIPPIVKDTDYGQLLTEATKGGQLRSYLVSLYPKFMMYRNGREILRSMENIEEKDSLDWKEIKINKSIKPGESSSDIPLIRERLRFWGYMADSVDISSKKYDSALVEVVKVFQKENGMEDDGILGKLSILTLNQSPSDMIDKISVNLERMRWLPDTVENTEFILVNIANFQLDLVNKLDTIHTAKVIVGKRYHESPIFMANMSYIVFSPYWNIPYSITRNEILPSIRKNPNYLNEKNMEVVTPAGKIVDPTTIDFSSKSFPYMIRQKPGGSNSLGLVKFMFPNSHSVYIHDTPARSLFSREDRALSHGCIRLQDPAKFAQILLEGNGGWTPQKIDEAMHLDHEEIVNLDRKIPVVILYLTFWADSKGKGHFRPDIYERDQEILAALRK